MERWSSGQLQDIDPFEFEKLLAQLFRKMGYIVEETQLSHDRGIDLIIKIAHFGLSHTWIVQAKRYRESVGVKAIREYSSLRYRDRVDGVIIATTSNFTREAQEEAAEHNVKLIDGNLLAEMLNHYLPGENESSQNTKTPDETIKDRETSTILRRGEEILAKEPVKLGKEKLIMVITNKNLFFKKESNAILSRKENVELSIRSKDLVGVHVEKQYLFLIAGQKNLTVYPLSAKRKEKIVEVLENLRPEYVRTEHLIVSSRKSSSMTILTNKRVVQMDIESGTMNDVMLSRIVEIELEGGFLKKGRLLISESSNGINKHYLEVDDIIKWKKEIEQIVKVS
ncbi:restriction endonuclease [Methanolobus sp. ZRKC2]|uniref:restriction endonuclease n=1 Tax=Methanolobus sp. ZRKC2 TaxID=3125783 RepID=UPI003244B926